MATISIVIPVFNRERLISECLNSILNQSFQDWEAIVVDDGSSDATLKVLQGASESDSRIKVMTRNRDPKGACTSRNIGLENAAGKYVVFHDSDDILHERCFQQRFDALESDPTLDFVVSPSLVFRESTDSVIRFLNFPYQTEKSDIVRLLIHDSPWWTSGPTWRRSFLEREKLKWPEGWERWQDWSFNLAALSRSPNYKRLELFDSYYREGPGIKGSNWQESWRKRISIQFGKICDDLLERGLVSQQDVSLGLGKLLWMLPETRIVDRRA